MHGNDFLYTQEKGLAIISDLFNTQQSSTSCNDNNYSEEIKKRNFVTIHPPRHLHNTLIHLGSLSKPILSPTLTNQLSDDLNTIKISDKFCFHKSIVPSGQYCSQNCDKCPKWGAKECLFGKQPYNITACDNCSQYGSPGCIFHDSKLNSTIFTTDFKKC